MRAAAARPEYRKLAEDLPRLALAFGCALPAVAQQDLLVFTLALECIDRVLDAIPHEEERGAFGAHLLDALDGGSLELGDDELRGHLRALRRVLAAGGAAPRFRRVGASALANTERMRTTRDAGEYLDCVRREGRYTVELALLFVGAWLNPACRAFLRSVAEMGNLVDKLKDARGDFRRGEMAVAPDVLLHARLVGLILRRVPAAAALHPSLTGFVRWGVGYL
jgi:hypothetical protein